jgi:Protein of unknown function (DUF4038)/Putative collagen-binding domain of a collagenase
VRPTADGWGLHDSGRFLTRNGTPRLLLGDTAWELFRRLTKEEAGHYLRTRAAQGFNTVLAVALPEYSGLRVPSIEGHVPFHDLDPRRPDEAYWAHVDWVVRRANETGLTVGILPTWGGNWHDAGEGGAPFFTPPGAGSYASWIAERYRGDDVIWVLGGDRSVTTPEHRAVIDAFASGIRRVVGHTQLITFHPSGCRSSSDFLPDADWLDFHMVQSGHTGWGTPNYQMIEQDYERLPAKPVLDAEPNHEAHPVMSPRWKPLPGYVFDDTDARRAAYHSVFAGACGHVYGCQEVWQMYDPARGKPMNGAHHHWKQALELPGAVQMGHLAALLGELGFGSWYPAQSVIRSGRGILSDHQRALLHAHDRRVLLYSPTGRDLHLDLTRWPGRTWQGRWWDPREGTWSTQTDHFTEDRFIVPHHNDSDGVLLIEEA